MSRIPNGDIQSILSNVTHSSRATGRTMNIMTSCRVVPDRPYRTKTSRLVGVYILWPGKGSLERTLTPKT